MMRMVLTPVLSAALAGCAGAKLELGLLKDGLVVEAEGAVESVLPLYLSSRTISGSAEVLRRSILAQPSAYIKKTQAQGPRPLALIDLGRLRRQLDMLGLTKPGGLQGLPRVLISLVERGPGAGADVGRASDCLRRALSARGYEAFDYSDQLNKKPRKTGSQEEALDAGLAQKADVVVSGAAEAQERLDPAAGGYRSFRARISARALAPATGTELFTLEAEADAMDLQPAGAAVKALENAGGLAAERLAGRLVERFQERTELGISLMRPPDWRTLLRFLDALRGIPGVAAVSMAGLTSKEARLRVFVEKLSTEDLAAAVRTLGVYPVELTVVEPDGRYIEMEWGRE